jgi:NAD(P)-dependent dehydrogenase (short-subunit alcohol dehydrogenase family)
MNNSTPRTALVTGATSGLGLDAAAQLADAGYARVTITGRSTEKAEAARAALVERTGKNVFETLAVDLAEPESVRRAVAEFAERDQTIDFLLLNAGMVSGSELVKTADGIEMTFASSLVGHHQLTMDVLARGLLTSRARIVIAGSEAARGDVPTFSVVDLPTLARKDFDGDLDAAAVSLIRQDGQRKYKPAAAYANAKLFVAWWAAALARRLPDGMTVNAVSPGSAPDTGAARHANFFMRRVMMPVMKKAPARFGMAAPVSVAAARYVEAADFGEDVNGEFFASAPKKMTGPIERVQLPPVLDRASQEAAWNATVSIAGGVEVPDLV